MDWADLVNDESFVFEQKMSYVASTSDSTHESDSGSLGESIHSNDHHRTKRIKLNENSAPSSSSSESNQVATPVITPLSIIETRSTCKMS